MQTIRYCTRPIKRGRGLTATVSKNVRVTVRNKSREVTVGSCQPNRQMDEINGGRINLQPSRVISQVDGVTIPRYVLNVGGHDNDLPPHSRQYIGHTQGLARLSIAGGDKDKGMQPRSDNELFQSDQNHPSNETAYNSPYPCSPIYP